MAQRPPAMLFLPPLPPLPLREGESVSIGRSRSCDLPLRSPEASRRHLEVVFGPSGWMLRDLDSTNGTYVNGERVGERVLQPGDRIEIGSDAITYCEVGVGLEPHEPDRIVDEIVVEIPDRANPMPRRQHEPLGGYVPRRMTVLDIGHATV